VWRGRTPCLGDVRSARPVVSQLNNDTDLYNAYFVFTTVSNSGAVETQTAGPRSPS
jgi:hypothetical protein